MIAKYGPGFNFRDLVKAYQGIARAREIFSRQLTEYFHVKHAILFPSARNALRYLLQAIGGNESVLLPAYNCIAVPEAVTWAGWRPVFTDIAPGSVNMTPETIKANLTPNIRAILLTHQFGIPSDIRPIMEICRRWGIFVIEDAAASIGALYENQLVGTFGDAAIISFGLTKVIPVGRIGVLLTNDTEIVKRITSTQADRSGQAQNLRDYTMAWGWWIAMQPFCYSILRKGLDILAHVPLYELVIPRTKPKGLACCTCSDISARLASMQLEHLPSNLAARRDLARIYTEELTGCQGIGLCEVPDQSDPAWMQFPIFIENKEHCYKYLFHRGVDLSWTYRYSCGESYHVQTVPNSDRAARSILGLPTYAEIPAEAARKICVLLRQSLRK